LHLKRPCQATSKRTGVTQVRYHGPATNSDI
jgi:hypothetical protein